jgi:hypothetical protein
MKVEFLLKNFIQKELCRHVHKTSGFREAMMVLGFSWLAEKVIE